MALQGDAFLALWNDVEPGREDEYERWHQTEHVPERVSIPGILAARRYIRTGGDQEQRFFTLYDVAGLEVFSSAPYLAVAERPTSWSLSMRPSLRSFLRQPCATRFTAGIGLAAHALTARFRLEPGRDIAAELQAWRAEGVVLHLGRVDPEARFPVPNASPAAIDGRDAWIVIVESGLAPALDRIGRALLPWLAERGASGTQTGQYALISAIRQNEVDPMLWQQGRTVP